MSAPLTRSDRDRVIGGVCGGIAERTGFSSSAVRLAFVLSCLLPGPQFVIYLILWAILPASSGTTGVAPVALPPSPSAYPVSQPDTDGRASMPTVSDVTQRSAPQPDGWLPDAPHSSADQR